MNEKEILFEDIALIWRGEKKPIDEATAEEELRQKFKNRPKRKGLLDDMFSAKSGGIGCE